MTSAMRRASSTGGSALALASSGMRQSSRSGDFAAAIGSHNFDHPRQVGVKRAVRRRLLLVAGEAAPGRLGREDAIDAFEHARRGAERQRQANPVEIELGVAVPPFQFTPYRREHLRRGALEGEDRLLVVADREEGAPPAARAGPGEKLLAKPRQNRPLRRGGVLRLVDQNMIDAGVELVEHPSRVGALEQDEACGRSGRRNRAGRARP